ncbi:MAG: hypothetical protein BWY15_01927 [Firmicutes bacterium ADurb.Bin193]|nr:MAG: hypothetical protein BWY15_01927 [Firmicutes bacterium ADurb.Bin193]
MKNDFVFTQTKEVIMTMDKTVTITTEKLETVDALGRKTLCDYRQSENFNFHNNDFNVGRAA